jgi:alternate signal-mediated exported protein
MNRKAKASLAVGAAAILLLGGAGTFAFWQDQTQSGGGTITSGTLALSECTPTSGSGWRDVTGGQSVDLDLSEFRIVPGDTLEYSCTSTVTASGTNLSATLAADTSEMFSELSDPVLRERLIDTSLTATTSSGKTLPNAQVTDQDDGETITIAARLTFDPATTGTIAQGTSVTLNNVLITLTQNLNPA